MQDYKFRFGLLFGALGIIGFLAVFSLGLVLTAPKPVKKAEVVAAVKAVEGEQNLVALCEASLTQTVVGNGGTVQRFGQYKVTQKGNTATVTVQLYSDLYTGKLRCDFQKSNWSITQVAPV